MQRFFKKTPAAALTSVAAATPHSSSPIKIRNLEATLSPHQEVAVRSVPASFDLLATAHLKSKLLYVASDRNQAVQTHSTTLLLKHRLSVPQILTLKKTLLES